jgi:hypothetical protein
MMILCMNCLKMKTSKVMETMFKQFMRTLAVDVKGLPQETSPSTFRRGSTQPCFKDTGRLAMGGQMASSTRLPIHSNLINLIYTDMTGMSELGRPQAAAGKYSAMDSSSTAIKRIKASATTGGTIQFVSQYEEDDIIKVIVVRSFPVNPQKLSVSVVEEGRALKIDYAWPKLFSDSNYFSSKLIGKEHTNGLSKQAIGAVENFIRDATIDMISEDITIPLPCCVKAGRSNIRSDRLQETTDCFYIVLTSVEEVDDKKPLNLEL